MQTVAVQALWGNLRRSAIRRKSVRDVGALTASSFAAAALSFVQGVLVARWLGPELYGVAALVMIYPGLAYTFFDARSSEATVKYLSEFDATGQRERVLAMCKLSVVVDITIAMLAFLTVLATAGWAAHRIAHHPDAVRLLIIYATAFLPRAFVGTSHAVLATLRRFGVIACVESFITVLRVALVLLLVAAKWQVAGIIWGNAIAMALSGLVYAVAASVAMHRSWGASLLNGNWQALKGRRREIFGFFAYNDCNALLGMVTKQLDLVLLGYYRNPTEVGYCKLARSLSSVVGHLVGPLQSVVYPELSRLVGSGERSALRGKVQRLAMKVGIPLAVVVLMATCLAPHFLPTLVGPAYLPAVAATQVLLVGSAVWMAFFWLRPLYLARGQVKAWTAINLVVAFLSLIAFWLVVPRWGYQGLALCLTGMAILKHSLAIAWIRRCAD